MSAHTEGSQQINLDDVQKAHAILHQPGEQVEVRVLLKQGGAMTGRFDNEEKMLDWLKDADSPDVAVAWWNIQQLVPEPATNDLQRRKASGNESMARRHWIFIDVDPVREHDPATEEELAAAKFKYEAVLLWLDEHGIEPIMTAMSGNGYHIYAPVDGWPNDDEHNNLVKAFIEILDAKFSDDRAKVDAAVANPGRRLTLLRQLHKPDDTGTADSILPRNLSERHAGGPVTHERIVVCQAVHARAVGLPALPAAARP